MTDSNKVFNGFAPLRNVVNLITLVERVKGRALNLPGMAVFYGPSGWGKSTAVLVAANTFDAYQVQIKSAWTKKHFCSALLKSMGIPEMRTVADMVNQIGEELSKSGRPLLIDEADHLVARGMVELVRDIYESSEAAVIMIGEEELPRKLMQWERVHGRMLDWVAAEPAVMADVTHLIPHYCRGLELDEPLKEKLLEDSQQSIRRICVNLDRVREVARTEGITTLTRKFWGDRPFFSGHAPRPRGFTK